MSAKCIVILSQWESVGVKNPNSLITRPGAPWPALTSVHLYTPWSWAAARWAKYLIVPMNECCWVEALDYLWVIIYFESSYSHQSPLRCPSLLSLIIPALAPLCLLSALLHVTPAIRHLQLPSAVIRSVILTRWKFLSLARSHILASLEQTHPSESLSRLWHWMPALSLDMTLPGWRNTLELSSALRREDDGISLTEQLTNVTMMKPMCD